MNWQPIETAPRDGKIYEVSDTGEVRVNGIALWKHCGHKLGGGSE